jgi:hypothetical protein
MRNTKVKKDDLYGGISYVDAGVVHIMKRRARAGPTCGHDPHVIYKGGTNTP